MKRTWMTLVLCLSLLTGLWAGDEVPTRGKALTGAEVAKRIDALQTRMTWHTSVDSAVEAAKEDGRMIFMLHSLGELFGET